MRIYFVLFWLIGVIGLLNVVIATVLAQFNNTVAGDAEIDPSLLRNVDELQTARPAIIARKRVRSSMRSL